MSVNGFRGLRIVGTLQISQNRRLVSINGFSGLQQTQNVYITNNQQLCYILGRLSNEEYWRVRQISIQDTNTSTFLSLISFLYF